MSEGGSQRQSSRSSSDQDDILAEEERKREDAEAAAMFDRSIRAFNLNPKRGIAYLLETHILNNSAEEVAEFLFRTRGLNKTKIGEWLGEPEEMNVAALSHFCTCFDFEDKSFLDALRTFLARLRLPGEAQKIDRIVEAFAKAFCSKNPSSFAGLDVVQILAFSTVMLNTDQHNPSIADSRRMTKEDFIRNNRGIDGGKDLAREVLEGIFDSIKAEELKTVEDRDDQGNLFTSTVRQGWLRKRGGALGNWQKRYFILTEQPPALYYFMTESDLDPRGFFMLDTGVEVRKSEGHVKQMELVPIPTELGTGQPSSLLKSAKFNSRMEIQLGRHQKCVLKGTDEADAWEWVQQLDLVIKTAERRALEYLASGHASADRRLDDLRVSDGSEKSHDQDEDRYTDGSDKST
mmetsp:Transcript_4076/g.15739  ORF Transcript_4076/g.15739 Transcript_4076/m.15739 type:complete len:405 (-) Transcript_4076:425-1639(-)